jgi:hypothetical protein
MLGLVSISSSKNARRGSNGEPATQVSAKIFLHENVWSIVVNKLTPDTPSW